MIIHILEQTLVITGFVLSMMLIIEYINVQTKGIWIKGLKKSWWLQLLIASGLGIIPGCLGAYAVVSMYTHNVIGFGALVASMIATSGDEAFIMFSMIPGTAIKITVVLFIVAMITGTIIHLFTKKKKFKPTNFAYPLHDEHIECTCFKWKEIPGYFKHISFQRAILLFFMALFAFLIASGSIAGHHHGESGHYLRITLLIVICVGLFIIATVPEHFLEAHIWEHIIKKHFVQIFLWIFGVLLALHFILDAIDIEQWIQNNQLPLLVLAVLIGIIPQSGPHLIFVTLFFSGHLPLSILLANSVVQDGHASLPLLAESKKSFLFVKAINVIIGMIVGLLGVVGGW
jgi:hypothetical protein